MNLKYLKAKLARPRHDCQVIKERQTGRHRGEPSVRWGLPLFFLGTVGLLFSVIITAFVVWNNPEQSLPTVQYRPSSGAVIPKPIVFPPVRQQPSPAASTYTVREHDTMWSIAYHRCGDGAKWKLIQAANSNDPWWISPGQVLKLPAPACA